MQKYAFRKPKKTYSKIFEKEKIKLRKILGKQVAIAHVGSTAVSDLGGKGIIDIAIATANLQKIKRKLENASYKFGENGGTTKRLFFKRIYRIRQIPTTIHIHVVKINSCEWFELVDFCDYLIKHPRTRVNYAKIKKEAVKKAKGNGEIYREHKRKFIENILKKLYKANQVPF